jgi:flagella basal body P-ring formation protein FlgA
MLATLAVAAVVAACATVEGDRITAGDLARVAPEFRVIAAQTELAHSPLPGVRRIFAAAELLRLAERAGITLDAPAEVCVERAAMSLDAALVSPVMQAALRTDKAQIEILKISRSVAPKGTIEFPLSGLRPLSDQSDTARWQGRIVYGDRTLPVWALVRIRAAFTRLVAKADLEPGMPLTESDVALEQCEGAAYVTAPLTPADVLGLVPRRPIPAGAAITGKLLDRPIEIARGDEVIVSAKQGGILLRVSGIAEGSGRRGEQIVIRNATSGKRFRARVQGKGIASI